MPACLTLLPLLVLAVPRQEAELSGKLALVRARVLALGARAEVGPAALALLAEALAAQGRFLELAPESPLAREAELDFLLLAEEHARRASEAPRGPQTQLAQLARLAREHLEEALARTEPSAAAPADALALARARARIRLAELVPDPDFLYLRAENELQRLIREAGADSGLGLAARLALVGLERGRARPAAALAAAEDVFARAVPADPTLPAWLALTPAQRAARVELLERALPELVDACLAQGEPERAARHALAALAAREREAAALSSSIPQGPQGGERRAALAAARALSAAGGCVGATAEDAERRWFSSEGERAAAGAGLRAARASALALELARSAAAEPGELARTARALLLELAADPECAVTPALLAEIARGADATLVEADGADASERARAAARALEAHQALRRALAGADAGTRAALEPAALFGVGSALAALERPLEAAQAFLEGSARFGDAGDGRWRAPFARNAYLALRAARRGDVALAPMLAEAEEALFRAGSSAGGAAGGAAVAGRVAEARRARGDLAGARAAYRAVPEGSAARARAEVEAALCLVASDPARASAELAALADALAPAAPERADALYALGTLAAERGPPAEVRARLRGFARTFPEPAERAAHALYLVVRADLALGERAEARADLAELATFAPGPFAVRAALECAAAAARARAAGGDALALAREELAALALANRMDAEAPSAHLRRAAALELELGRWGEAEATLRALQARAPEDDDDFLRAALARALLGQERCAEARALLDERIPQAPLDEGRPTRAESELWCRAVVGWLALEEDGRVRAVAGAGGAAELELAAAVLAELLGAPPASDAGCARLELGCERVLALLQAGAFAPPRRGEARILLDELEAGDPGLARAAARCGDEGLARRAQWLRSRL